MKFCSVNKDMYLLQEAKLSLG